jgi:hypothetical protein
MPLSWRDFRNFMETGFPKKLRHTAGCRGPSDFGRKHLPRHRIGIALFSLLLITLTVGFRFELGRAFPANILGGLRSRHAATSTPPSSSVLWSADMETGDLSQWSQPDVPGGPNVGGGVFESGTSSAGVDAVSVAHRGTHSAKLFINTLNAPGIPTSGVRLFRWLEPQTHSDLYYRVWYYFPRRYIPNGDPAWWNVFQWKSKRGGGSDPFFALNVGNRPDGSMYFYLYNQNSKTSYSQTVKNIPDSQWFRVDAFYQCTGDHAGHVTFWQDAEQIFDVSGVQTRYPEGDCEWSVNNYSNSLNPPTATIYVDDAAICAGGRCP